MNRRQALKNTGKLVGSAATIPSLLTILNSCSKQTRLDWDPEFLSQEQAEFVASFVDTILPKTETPGALELKVDLFIDKVLADLYNDQGKTKMSSEMDQFNDQCKEKFGAGFAHLDLDDRKAVLSEAERNSNKFNGQVWGTAVGEQAPVGFYRTLKSMTLWAYFSSEQVGKNILSYDPIPGNYLGCIPLSEVGNTWSL